jgi:hypothetical protein
MGDLYGKTYTLPIIALVFVHDSIDSRVSRGRGK